MLYHQWTASSKGTVGEGSKKMSKRSKKLTRKSVHGTRMPPPIVFISPAIKHWVYNK